MFATIILVSGIVAIIPLVSFSLREAIDSRDQVIAGMLAQEGAELVQNLRDNNWVQGEGAFDTSKFPDSDHSDCQIDYNDSDVKTCNNGAGSKVLKLNGAFYEHESGNVTKFQRKIELDFINSDTQLVVTSVVVWGGDFPTDPISATNCNTLKRCAFTKTTLTNWKPAS